jgi:hypothetical protein
MHKYNAQKTVFNGETFPSKLEASVYAHLFFLQSNGKIKDLSRKASTKLTEAEVSYKADMKYFCLRREKEIWVEAKGMETERWRLIKKLWKKYGLAPLEIYKGNSRGIYLAETITP